jgi:hypothetical protein
MGNFDINDSQVREEYNGSNTKEVVVFIEPLKDNIKNKIYEYVNIMRDTNNEDLYFSTFKKLKKLVGGFDNLPDAVISLGTLDEKGNPKVICITSTKNNGANPKGNNKVYHTSDVKGIDKLKGTFRSKDKKWFYPDKRVYVSLGAPMGRDGGHSRSKYIYQITDDFDKDLKIDQDFQWAADKYSQPGKKYYTNSRYYTISGKTEIPVKKVNSLFKKYSTGLYTEALEFFVRNGIQLTHEQLEYLKEMSIID